MPPSAYDKAAQLLAARPHFRRELAAKLTRRGFPRDEVEAALDRLTEQGYLDDIRAARDFAAHRLARGEGRVRVLAELLRRGAAPEAADQAVGELAPADDRPDALAAAARWRARGGNDPQALARHLARKGFSPRAIVAALQRAGGGDLDDLP
ncbi:MAG TPA: regulatory protein RecX [Thermoanaerobaculia bacterium]|nr:regulatory protein RecX [Thermoanaerobaculia bacterium]